MYLSTKRTLCGGPLRKRPGGGPGTVRLVHYKLVSTCVNLSLVTESRPAGTFDIVHHFDYYKNTQLAYQMFRIPGV